MTRAIDGILLLDKPSGLTSNRALQTVKRLYQAQKAGHTGSLDPAATGMLPICLGQATKISRYLLAAKKSYQVVAQFGVATDTADADGAIVATGPVPELGRTQLEAVLHRLIGDMAQIPPMYSALKHKGERLYALARRGEQVERKPRQVTIYDTRLLAYEAPLLSFTVTCSKGTYVRSLVEDLGAELGTLAHVAQLRRLGVDPFQTTPMHSLESLAAGAEKGFAALDELLLPVDRGIDHWPRLDLSEEACERLAQGQRVAAEAGWPETRVRVYSGARGFIGIGEIVAGELTPKRLFPDLRSSR